MGAQSSREMEVLENATPEAIKGEAKGVSYEVILSPRIRKTGEPRLTPKRVGILTRQDIDDKIAAAERRRKTRQLSMRLKLANNDEHAEAVRQAMTDYEERKRRETEARYQRRLYIFAENQEAIAAVRAKQRENTARRIESVKKAVDGREKTFRESIKEKLNQKFEKFKENYAKFQEIRQEAARLKSERAEVVQSTMERQIEQRAKATAEKLRRKHEIIQENREANIHEKVTKIQKQHAKIDEANESLNRSFEASSAKKLMNLEVRLDRSVVKRQLFENEIRKKAQADLEKVEQARKYREESETKFSESVKETLEQKLTIAEKVREQNLVAKQHVFEKQAVREQNARNGEDDSERLREKLDEKQRRNEENRAAILNAKIERCRREYTKVKQTKEIVDEQIKSQERATQQRLQKKLTMYKENREKRLVERQVVHKTCSPRASLQEITNDSLTAEDS